jgi:hypothetical protein
MMHDSPVSGRVLAGGGCFHPVTAWMEGQHCGPVSEADGWLSRDKRAFNGQVFISLYPTAAYLH